jgi:bifunctional DNase/RNase
MIEVVIDSVRVSLTNQQRIIILRDVNQERYLPIWIGTYEAEAITISLQEIELARPQTHDLVKSIMTKLNARLLRVEVVALQDDVFYGNLVVETNGNVINIDSRTSDAFALAVRMHVPILVSDEIMESAGIIPERDLQGDEPSSIELEDTQPVTDQEVVGEDRLSVFEDYLKNLDIDSPPDTPDEDDTEPDEDKPDLSPG